MVEKIRKIAKNPYFIISVVYLLAHFFLLILSGCWWDDWTFMSHNLGYINEVASQSGRPEWNFLIPLCWSLPNNGRILIFFLYYLDSLFVYEIAKDSKLFNKTESLIIALLFSIIPVNDARILISNFPYTVGLFLFYLSFMLFVKWNNSNRNIICRIGLLVLFFFSFILNSVLAYYYIIIAYVFVLLFKESKEKNLIRRFFISVKNTLIKYPDFFVLPFVYYFSNKILFPTYGPVFGNYNSVTIKGLIKCILYIPLSMIKIFTDMISLWIKCLGVPLTIVIVAIGVLLAWYFNRNSNTSDDKQNLYELLFKAVIGLFVLFMGLFPYVTVRGRTINTTGVNGRDAILVCFGVAIIMSVLMMIIRKRYRYLVVAVVCLLGICGFGRLYLEWQKDYYYQLSMENLFKNEIIRDNDTFFLIDLNESEVDAQRYYSLNANGYNVFKEETRLFVPTVSVLYLFESKENMKSAIEVLDYAHVMKDYAPDDYCFDAVLNYTNNLEWYEVLELKYYELFDKERFDKEIKSRGTLEVYLVGDDFTSKIIKGHNDGEIRNDQDVLNFLNEYLLGY